MSGQEAVPEDPVTLPGSTSGGTKAGGVVVSRSGSESSPRSDAFSAEVGAEDEVANTRSALLEMSDASLHSSSRPVFGKRASLAATGPAGHSSVKKQTFAPEVATQFVEAMPREPEERHGMTIKEIGKHSTIKRGTILWTFNQNKSKRKVPYFIVPDAMAKDPLLVEKVSEAMDLALPNLILRFSRILRRFEEWNDRWMLQGDDDGEVSDEMLPFDIPYGVPRTVSALQRYMMTVVGDRVRNILLGISSVCAQAGAWVNVSHAEGNDPQFGFYDYAPQMVVDAADSNAIIFSTWVMEEAAFHDGASDFINALYHFSGHEAGSEREKPKIFREDVEREVRLMGLEEKNHVADNAQKQFARAQLRGASFKGVSDSAAASSKLGYLPSMYLTHLLVFESKTTERIFNERLMSRTPCGNFIMSGDEVAMRIFGESVKLGSPVFILRGTGNCANQAALVFDHMKWRKRLDDAQGEQHDELDEMDKGITASAGSVLGRWGDLSASQGGRNRLQDDQEKEADGGGAGPNADNKYALGNALSKLNELIEAKKKAMDEQRDKGALLQAALTKVVLSELQRQGEEVRQFELRLNEAMEGDGMDEETMHDVEIEAQDLVVEIQNLIKRANRNAKVSKDGKLIKPWDEEDDYDVKSKEEIDEIETLAKAERRFGILDPQELYEQDLSVGRQGVAWEREVGMHYEKWLRKRHREGGGDAKGKIIQISEPPREWSLPREGSDWCEEGHDFVEGGKGPCKREDCPDCMQAKVKERQFLRKLVAKNLPYDAIDKAMVLKYIRWGQEMNPILDDPAYASETQNDPVAALARVIYSNVYYPPVEDAVVVIDILSRDLHIEEIMDQVTNAMSSDTMRSEVGEKTAFRRRLLMAWQMSLQLRYNADIHRRWMHILQSLIIFFSFISVLFGTLTAIAQDMIWRSTAEGVDLAIVMALTGEARAAAEERIEKLPGLEWINILDFHWHSVNVNLATPLVTSLLLALNARWSPHTKMKTLTEAYTCVESEIFKCRARIGEYSGSSSGTAAFAPAEGKYEEESGGAASGEGEGKKKKKKSAHGGPGNPRLVFAKKIEAWWNELASSEVRQESLKKPSSYDLINLNKRFECFEHPALFEEGKVLTSNNQALINATLKRFSWRIDDDGLRNLSASDYIDIRVMPYKQVYEKKAPQLRRNLTILTVIVFMLTSVCTGLGAFDQPQWIPVTMGLSAAVGAVMAYTQVEQRLLRTNAASVSLNRLMTWWWGLSVIEQRIPSNKSFLVETMETIIQTEAGTIRVSSQKEETAEEGGAGGAGAGAGGDGAGDK